MSEDIERKDHAPVRCSALLGLLLFLAASAFAQSNAPIVLHRTPTNEVAFAGFSTNRTWHILSVDETWVEYAEMVRQGTTYQMFQVSLVTNHWQWSHTLGPQTPIPGHAIGRVVASFQGPTNVDLVPRPIQGDKVRSLPTHPSAIRFFAPVSPPQ